MWLFTIAQISGYELFYFLFLSPQLWGYFGPLVIVIFGYYITKKSISLCLVWFIVESLFIANYLSLLAASPGYWWQIIILILGLIQCTFRLLGR